MIIEDLQRKAIKVSELETDHRWEKWTKWVDVVDPNGQNGFAFKGDFINDGTLEVNVSSLPRVILCCTETGSRANRGKNYAVVTLTKNGEILKTDLATDDRKGWAIRLRDPMLALLAQMKEERETVKEVKYTTIQIKEHTALLLQGLQTQVGETSLDRLLMTLIVSFKLPGDATNVTPPTESPANDAAPSDVELA